MSGKQLGLILAGLGVYALVAALALVPSRAPAGSDARDSGTPAEPRLDGQRAGALAGSPFRSVTMQIQRVDWIDKYKKDLDEILDVGADTVMFVIDTRMENGHTSRIWLDQRMTPTPQQLADLIGHAKSKNLRVILMPIVLLHAPVEGEWRGKINPEFWHDWWESYREMITHFAWVAEANKADMLVIGSELVSTEDKTKEWTKTIQEVRKIYKGKLTYSSNWDHYTSVTFWDQLDMIGMNSYWKLGKSPETTVQEIKDNWQNIQKDLIPFIKEQGKPLMFLEIGWFSQENVAYEPWDYTQDKPIALDLQRRLYQGFFESWYGNPQLGGFSVWEWSPGDGGPDDKGYTPENKPAEHVLREWFAKPRWQVKVN
jgi:hypothetical protein